MGLDSRAVEDATRGRAAAVRFLVRGVSMKKTAQELARAIDASVEGDGTVEITGVAAPERASSSELIFVEAAKHAERAASSSAHCVVAPEGISIAGKTVLRTKEAKVA